MWVSLRFLVIFIFGIVKKLDLKMVKKPRFFCLTLSRGLFDSKIGAIERGDFSLHDENIFKNFIFSLHFSIVVV